MSTRKQREILRQRRMEFDRRVEENRPKMEAFAKESVATDDGLRLLEDMTKQELIAYAYERGIEINKYAKKNEIISEIKKVE